jgi:hypothetical protein
MSKLAKLRADQGHMARESLGGNAEAIILARVENEVIDPKSEGVDRAAE